MAHVPSKIMTPGEVRTAKAALKKSIGEHAAVIKFANKAIKAAEAETAKAIKAAKGSLSEATKAYDTAVKAANKELDATKKMQDKIVAEATKLGVKSEAALASLDTANAAAT